MPGDNGDYIWTNPPPSPGHGHEGEDHFPPGNSWRSLLTNGIPLIPKEFPEHSSLVVHTNIDKSIEVKVVPGPMTFPDPVDLDSYKASSEKNFYYKTRSLQFRLSAASVLAQDMSQKSQLLENKDMLPQIAKIEKILSDLVEQTDALYKTAGFNAYPVANGNA